MKKLIVIVIIMGLALGAYLLFLNSQDVTVESEDDNKVISAYSHGGLCPWGECNETVLVNSDGSFIVTSERENGTETINSGTVSVIDVKALKVLIRSADFEQIREQPFTDD
ncbi:MAG: hypothetical protein V1719_00060, partial [Patescibacteria group bacterium]